MTMTEATGLIPEERCAHFELRNMDRGRSRCPDCGELIDVGRLAMFTGEELQRSFDDGEEAGGQYARRWAVEEATKAANSLRFVLDRAEVGEDGTVTIPHAAFPSIGQAEDVLRSFIERASDA